MSHEHEDKVHELPPEDRILHSLYCERCHAFLGERAATSASGYTHAECGGTLHRLTPISDTETHLTRSRMLSEAMEALGHSMGLLDAAIAFTGHLMRQNRLNQRERRFLKRLRAMRLQSDYPADGTTDLVRALDANAHAASYASLPLVDGNDRNGP